MASPCVPDPGRLDQTAFVDAGARHRHQSCGADRELKDSPAPARGHPASCNAITSHTRRHLADPHRTTIAQPSTVNLDTTDLPLKYAGTFYGLRNGRRRRIFADGHGVPVTA
jgi:hypothetical protein